MNRGLLSLPAIALTLLVLGAATAPQSRYIVVWAMESRVFPGDQTGHDFLAVFDIGDAADFGRLVAMLPVATRSQMAHHSNTTMPPNHLLFANDFMAGQSNVFDVSDPRNPRLATTFTSAAGYTHPHSFEYLSNGNVLATYQIRGSDVKGNAPGALVELDSHGHVVRVGDASASNVDPNVRPYGLLVVESLDRVVTTSAAMPPVEIDKASHVVQVWRLSDLKLLETIDLKPAPLNADSGKNADDAVLLADGKTVLVKTVTGCSLYRIDNLESDRPTADFVYDFGYRSCSGVPVVIGNYWIQSTFKGHTVVALDVSDPRKPVQAGLLYLGPEAIPHWISREPGTSRFAITGFGSLRNSIHFATVDQRTGALTLSPQSIDFTRKWPDGWDGPAIPHAVVFY